ncbi:CLUMA_CG012691, isoform A [Clunio marinus]|uniref:CLUMA_CG012691, isoform A n=1 Tax=Clunio marinus TaxID=568069 RepID=A0A1J1ILP8_9DIPT|nr:CLUMA_CG012691, isoform A [Clunio marinus]
MCSDLSCPLCCLSKFPDIETFKLNLIKVNSKPIKCPLCDEILLGLDKLTIHLFGHSLPTDLKANSEVLHPSSKKEQKPKQSRIKLVKISSPLKASEEKFRCEICGFVFVDQHLLDLHLNLVHNFMPNNDEERESTHSIKNETKRFQCHLCSKHFKMKGALRIHIRVAHFKYHDQDKKQINIADFLKSQKSIDQCTLKAERLSLQEPDSSENNYLAVVPSPASCKAPSPQSSVNGDNLDTKRSADKSSKIFQCDDCKKVFTTKYFLKKHKRLHTGETPYSCEKCGKNFFFQQSFHKHMNYHNDEKPYKCAECGRSFKELSTLHNHERIHSGVKPFGCEICGKFFRQRVSYLVHSRIHTGALPYKCSECGKGFRYKVSQRSHKCSGVLVKQPGELLQKLMQNSSISPTSTITSPTTVTNVTNLNTNDFISISNTAQHETHDLCFDDLLKDDSYDKIMKNNVHEPQLQFIPQISTNNRFNENMNGSTIAFSNLTIDTNYNLPIVNNNHNFNMNYPLETINEDSIKELLRSLR